MKESRFTETQIVKAIKEYKAGRNAEDLCRELGISAVTFLQMEAAVWRPGSAGPQTSEGVRGRELTAEENVCEP